MPTGETMTLANHATDVAKTIKKMKEVRTAFDTAKRQGSFEEIKLGEYIKKRSKQMDKERKALVARKKANKAAGDNFCAMWAVGLPRSEWIASLVKPQLAAMKAKLEFEDEEIALVREALEEKEEAFAAVQYQQAEMENLVAELQEEWAAMVEEVSEMETFLSGLEE